MKLGMLILELPGFKEIGCSSYSVLHGIVTGLRRDKRMEVTTLFSSI